MKKIILFIFLKFFIQGYTQDSIVNFLDSKNNKATAENFSYVQYIVKKDSLWELNLLDRGGRLLQVGMFKSSDLKVPQGQVHNYARNGTLINLVNHDKYGNKHGVYASWFLDGNIKTKGNYVDDNKEGVWHYYHNNGEEANKVYYFNDNITNFYIKDELGNTLKDSLINKKGGFKGGQKKLHKYIQKELMSKLTFELNGKMDVHFVVNTNGKIKDIYFDEKIPEELEQKIIDFFLKSPEWEPSVHMNRKVETPYTLPFTFK